MLGSMTDHRTRHPTQSDLSCWSKAFTRVLLEPLITSLSALQAMSSSELLFLIRCNRSQTIGSFEIVAATDSLDTLRARDCELRLRCRIASNVAVHFDNSSWLPTANLSWIYLRIDVLVLVDRSISKMPHK